MAEPVSHKLIVRSDDEWFVVSGNPTIGYTTRHITGSVIVAECKRSWQAVAAAHSHNGGAL